MSKGTQAKVLTGLIAAAIIAFAALRNSGWDFSKAPARTTAAQEKPQEAIYRMLDAARGGDAAAYIACHTGQAAARLEQSRAEMGEDAFARYLRERNREIKGVAINDPGEVSGGEARIRVEYVFEDRNEAQQYLVKKLGGTWKIAGLDQSERVETLIPYGTPVY